MLLNRFLVATEFQQSFLANQIGLKEYVNEKIWKKHSEMFLNEELTLKAESRWLFCRYSSQPSKDRNFIHVSNYVNSEKESNTTKLSKFRGFFGLYFPVIRLNTRYTRLLSVFSPYTETLFMQWRLLMRTLHRKLSFSLRISSVSHQFRRNCGFGHIY